MSEDLKCNEMAQSNAPLSHFFVCLPCSGNGLPAQVGVPITRLPVQRQLSRGQSLGPENRRIFAASVQRSRLHRRG